MPVKSTKDAKYWQKQVSLSVEKRKKHERWWDANLKKYAPSVDTDPEAYGANIHTNRTFTAVERKKADRFFQRPDVTLIPSPLMEVMLPGPPDAMGQPTQVSASEAILAHQQIVNEKLGEDGIDASEMMDAVQFDIDCTQGTGWTKMGYELFAVEQETLDPVTGEPRVVPVPVAERCYWEHFSGKQAIIPANFRKTEWEKAQFLGLQFELPLTAHTRKAYNLPPDFEGRKSDGQQHYDHGDADGSTDDVFTGVEIWYRSHLYRDDILHPDHLTQLILVDGLDEPVIERDSPYQTLLPNGQLSPDSLIGFPIHPFSVRKLTDSAYVASDATMIGPLENELDIYRMQQIQFRDAATLKWGYKASAIPADAVSKMTRSPIAGMIALPDEAFPLEHNLVELPQGNLPRENFAGMEAVDNDIARTVGVDGPGAGVQSQTSQTATETQVVQANANARLDKERGTLLKRYCKGVTKFSTLIQRYLPVEQAAQIVGPQAAGLWDQWRKAVPSSLAFTAMPDSALRVDQAVDRKQATDFYSFIANDPYCQNARVDVLKSLFRKHHLDPKNITPPPPAKPEPPKLSFSFKGEDLVGPQAVIVLGIAEQLGIQIDPSWITISQGMLQQDMMLAAQAEAQDAEAKGDAKHGGKLPQSESLSKHAADKTGGMQNTGAPAALGAAGGMVK